MTYLKVYIAGLLTLITISAIGFSRPDVYGFRDVSSAFTTTTSLACIATSDLKEHTLGYESTWIGINKNPNTGDVYSVVELYTQTGKWMLFEHYIKQQVSCNLGIGEEWLLNPEILKKLGETI